MVPAVKALPGPLFGQDAAARLEALLRDGLAAGEGPDGSIAHNAGGAEWALRFLSLLVRKNRFRHIDTLAAEIEKRLDGQKGILEVRAETAAPLDAALAEFLKKRIQEKTGAAGIRLSSRERPELLGGCRLWIGGLCVDASLKGQLAKMAEDLTHG
jgi:F0F1-type ATP synthase delta subunit